MESLFRAAYRLLITGEGRQTTRSRLDWAIHFQQALERIRQSRLFYLSELVGLLPSATNPEWEQVNEKRESLVVVWSRCVSCRLSRRYIKTGAKIKSDENCRKKLETRSLVVIRFLFFWCKQKKLGRELMNDDDRSHIPSRSDDRQFLRSVVDSQI